MSKEDSYQLTFVPSRNGGTKRYLNNSRGLD